MKNKKNILIIMFASILSFSSCKDDDDASGTPAQVEQTNTEKLCGKNFIISDFVFIQNGDTLTTGLDTNFISACSQDDIWRFETNGIATIDDGAIKCDPADPQTDTSTWAFYDSETKIIFDAGLDSDTINIITNNGTVLTMSFSEIEQGDILEGIYTFTAQ